MLDKHPQAGVMRERLRAAMGGFALHAAVQLVLIWPVVLAAAPGSESPTEAVRGTITQVIRILEDPALKDPAKLIPRRHMLAKAIASRFDYAEMSRRSLAAEWKPLTTAERTEFVEAFKGFLIDRYAERIEGYSGEQVEYLSERTEGTYAEVRTELVSDKTTIPVDYRLLMNEGRWHAYDLVVDGISLVKNYRSQFQKIIRETSYQELIKKLRERTVANEPTSSQ
ncbi:organic solvent tolerance ABC transporter substrate-binding protein [Nitrospira sp.]|nr:organic solvent tolerance ABC transporter substrate-binding protein [Nitrospira sp.]